MTMARSQPLLLGVQVTDVRSGYLGGRRRWRRDYITTSVVLLGVQVTDVRRGYLGGRRRRQVPAPAPAPGLHHDYGQITTSVVLLGVQVPAPAPGSRPDHNLCVAMHGKPLGVSEVRRQMASAGQTMGQMMWKRKLRGVKSCGHGSRWGSARTKARGHGSRWGSKHVDTGVAGGQRGSKHVVAGVSGDQSMWTRESLGVKSWSKHVERESLGVSGGQSM